MELGRSAVSRRNWTVRLQKAGKKREPNASAYAVWIHVTGQVKHYQH